MTSGNDPKSDARINDLERWLNLRESLIDGDPVNRIIFDYLDSTNGRRLLKLSLTESMTRGIDFFVRLVFDSKNGESMTIEEISDAFHELAQIHINLKDFWIGLIYIKLGTESN